MAELRESMIQRRVRREVRSPRAAALAGIVYSILMSIGMSLTYNLADIAPEDITQERLQNWADTASIVIALVPFAGIAFLWFTGVVRDQLSYQEGRFFATIFFGSGIVQVVLLFIWSAIFGADRFDAALVDHHHICAGFWIPVCRQSLQRVSLHIPCLGVRGEYCDFDIELPKHTQSRAGFPERVMFAYPAFSIPRYYRV